MAADDFAVGPLGALPLPVVEQEMLTRVRAFGQDTSRPRGRRLDGTYVYAGGSPFGGFGGGLPSARRPTVRQRIGDFLSGRRGAVLSFGYDSARVETARRKSGG